jgi:dTDP-4-dehydrorhamnose reductase
MSLTAERPSPYEVDDVRTPRSVYGQSKAMAEMEVQGILPDCCIARNLVVV